MSEILNLSLENIEEAQKGKVVCCLTAEEFCQPCKIMAPIFEEIASENEGVTFIKAEVDKHCEFSDEFKVTSVPAFLFMNEGTEMKRLVGLQKKEVIEGCISNLIEEETNTE